MNVLVLVIGLMILSECKTVREVSENDIPDLHYLDTSANPCENFYQYTCGNFKNIYQRPDDLDQISIYTLIEDDIVKVANEILSYPKLPTDPNSLKKVKSAYKACINTTYVDNLDYIPEVELIKQFGGMSFASSNKTKEFSWGEIGNIVGKTGIPQMFSFFVYNVYPGEYFFMLDRDTWEDPKMIKPRIVNTYDRVLEESFNRAAKKHKGRSLDLSEDTFDVFLRKMSDGLIKSYNSPDYDTNKALNDLEEIKNFKAKLLDGGDLNGEIKEMVGDPTLVTLRDLQEWTDRQFEGEINMNWVDYLGNIFKWSGINVDENFSIFNSNGIEFIYGILNLVRNTDPSIVKNFVLFRTLLLLSPDGGQASRKAFEEYYKSQGLRYYDRWEYCTRKLIDVDGSLSLGLAVTRNYSRYYFDNNKIFKAVSLSGEIRDAFKTIVSNSDWVDEESRDAVYQKADNIAIDLAYPHYVDDHTLLDDFYENVGICEWDHYGNSQRIRAFKQAYALTKLNNNEDFWDYSPFEVNAFSRRQDVKIMMPISMLHDLHFSGNNPILDYSRLGATLGHEMTHHFDNDGIKYDQTGYFSSPFISSITSDAFHKKTECFKKQYDGYYVPEIDKYVNGTTTLNENLADNGGLRKSFLAYQKLIQDKKIQNASRNYTLEQLFFIGYGTMWCSDSSTAYLEHLIDENTKYPPMSIRVLGTLSNFQEFSDAFNCPVGSPMNPEEKCVLW